MDVHKTLAHIHRKQNTCAKIVFACDYHKVFTHIWIYNVSNKHPPLIPSPPHPHMTQSTFLI